MPQPANANPYEQARDTAVEAALEAGHLIRTWAGRISDVREKGKHDLVTEIDEEAQRIILRSLRAGFPDYDVLAEEGADLEAIEPATKGHRWIIDPIDGTTNFLHGVPPYAVSIALQRGAEVVVGVVLDVARGELFTAVRGEGLYVNGVRAGVSSAATLKDSLLSTGFPYRSFGHVDVYLQAMRRFRHETQAIRRHGAASVDLAYVACGRFDGFFETGLLPWDVAAGLLLIEEGGGRVTDYRDAPNPVFTSQLLASNGRIHAAMLDVLEPMRDVRI
ncbi:MAG: inositol monophosphatase family protein [Rhodothermales bacterium]